MDQARPWVLDSAFALGLLAASLFAAGATTASIPPLQLWLMVATSALYAARRAAPLPVLLASGALVVVMIGLGFGTAVVGAGLFLVAYTVAAHGSRASTIVGAIFATCLVVVVSAAFPDRMPFGEAVTNMALFAGSFVLGRAMRLRRDAAVLAAERAELTVRIQREEARASLTEERLRIARELHDVVGHSLGVIALQAGVGARVVESDPAEAKAALLAIAERSRDSLREVRQILATVREPSDVADPTPGLAAIPALVASLAEAGLRVDLEQSGEPWPMPASMETAVYRVLQESLTNVVRHAGTGRATVRVAFAPAELVLRIIDGGRGASAGAGPASGQLGMRERVTMWGGSLEAGPRDAGGYEVVARLPRQEGDA